MATALALLTVAMAFAMVSGPGEVEATGNGEEPRLLEEWEITTYGGDEYLVLLGTKRYTTSQLDGWTNVYIVSDGNPSSLAGALENCTTIRNVVVSTDIKHLGDETFKGCTA